MISSQLSSPNYRGDLRIDYICNKVGAYDLYAKAWGGMLSVFPIYAPSPISM